MRIQRTRDLLAPEPRDDLDTPTPRRALREPPGLGGAPVHRRLVGALTTDVLGSTDDPTIPGPETGHRDLTEVIDSQTHRLQSFGHTVTSTCTTIGLPASVVDTLNRIIEEAVSNILHHGGPHTECEITVTSSARGVNVVVANTIGSAAPHQSSHIGLTALDERVRLLHGIFFAGVEADGRWTLRAYLPTLTILDPGEPDDIPADAGEAEGTASG